MTTGRRPFFGEDTISTLMAVNSTAVTPPRKLNPLVPENLDLLIGQLLAKQPDERPQTARGR